MHSTPDLALSSSVGYPQVPPAPQRQLGINAKSASTRNLVASALQRLRYSKAVNRRFELQAMARSLVPHERVFECLRTPILSGGKVQIFYAPEFATASLGGLQTCGSVWMCAVCAARIAERRRVEVETAVAGFRASGGCLVFATFTLQHNSDDSLAGLLHALLESFRALKSGRFWKDFALDVGLVGSIRGLEITHGKNGWHPHLHVVFFLPALASLASFSASLVGRWAAVVRRAGHYASEAYGCHVTSADDEVSGYLLKSAQWTITKEIVAGASKVGRLGGRSMAMLLYASRGGGGSVPCKLSAALWREYAACFKGRRMLVWSRGLRALLLPDEADKTDEDVAAEVESDGVLLSTLPIDEWDMFRANDLIPELLVVAAQGDAGVFADWVAAMLLALKPEHVLCPDDPDVPNHFWPEHLCARG